jgi:RasGEF domain/RasGEF N-terminal motif
VCLVFVPTLLHFGAKSTDQNSLQAFLLNARQYRSPEELLDSLIAKFHAATVLSGKRNTGELTINQLRIVHILRTWIMDFVEVDFAPGTLGCRRAIAFVEQLTRQVGSRIDTPVSGEQSWVVVVPTMLALLRRSAVPTDPSCLCGPLPSQGSESSGDLASPNSSGGIRAALTTAEAGGTSSLSESAHSADGATASSLSDSGRTEESAAEDESSSLAASSPAPRFSGSRGTPATAAAVVLPPKRMDKVELLSLQPLEVAQQMSLIEFALFRAIQPHECLPRGSRGKAPSVEAIISRFNLVSNWVATEVLMPTSTKQRVAVLKHFVQVALKCRALNNFNTLLEITAGLNMAPVRRLKKTWLSLPSKWLQVLADLETLMDNKQNFKAYREALRSCKRPALPYFGIFLRDITFVDVGNPDYMAVPTPTEHAHATGGPPREATAEQEAQEQEQEQERRASTDSAAAAMVNFEKMLLLNEVVQDIQYYKACLYSFSATPVLQNYLQNLLVLPEETLHKYSVSREPPEVVI